MLANSLVVVVVVVVVVVMMMMMMMTISNIKNVGGERRRLKVELQLWCHVMNDQQCVCVCEDVPTFCMAYCDHI